MRRLYLIATIPIMLLALGCRNGGSTREPGSPQADSVASTVDVVRLDLAATEWNTLPAARQEALLADNTDLWRLLLMMARIDTVASLESVTRYASTPAVKMFGPEVARHFPADNDSLANQVAIMLGRLYALAPQMPTPRIAAVLLPYNQSVILSDSARVAYVATNHYLGPDHPAYRGFPEYVRQQKLPERIAPDLAEALLRTAFPADSARTVIQRLLYEGALVEIVARVCDADEQFALGYSAQQYARAEADEAAAWNALLTRKLLFSSDPDVASRLVDPAPATSILNAATPGRLGRFIGHRIVAAWLDKNPGNEIINLLTPKFYTDPNVLAQAGYAPKP